MKTLHEERAAAHAAARDAEVRLSTLISRLRLATVIPGAVCVVWAIVEGGPPGLLLAGLVLLGAFGGLVVWHARVDERSVWFDALHVANLQAVARIERAWDRLPPADPPRTLVESTQVTPLEGARILTSPARSATARRTVDIEHHPYAMDLDLFGRASLAQWLGPAATPPGRETMQEWLLHPAEPADVLARQEAVIELAPAVDWRERLEAHGRLIAGTDADGLERFLHWAEGPGAFLPARTQMLRLVARGLTAAIWILIAAQAAGTVTAAFWMTPVLIGIVLSFTTARQVHAEFTRAGAGEHAFARYADLFAHATAAPGRSPHLQAIHDRLGASRSAAAQCLRRLNRILGFSHLRAGAGILHFVVQALTLWDLHVFFALDTWRRQAGPRVRGWMGALGELDALSAFAQIRAANPAWCIPEVAVHEAAFRAEGLGHPLIPDDRRVGNDVVVGPPGTLLLITGSNMSGKSTLLRAIGLNTVLAQAGAPACASSLRLAPVDLETSIRVQDSLEQGLSYFMAALARLKGVIDRADRSRSSSRVVMYLLDEILQGTNTVERAIAVRGVARHLLRTGAIGVMTTHDLALAAAEPLNSAARLAHFTEIVDAAGEMTFDYRLRPGLATSRNALRLMHLIGLDLEGATDDSDIRPPAGGDDNR